MILALEDKVSRRFWMLSWGVCISWSTYLHKF